MQLIWICLGGAVGTGARYVLTNWALRTFGATFPYGTLAVNAIGSLLIAFLMFVALESPAISVTVRLALTVGVLGGFTTYSTFSFETMRYLQSGSVGLAFANVVITTVVCLAACFLGWAAARWVVGA